MQVLTPKASVHSSELAATLRRGLQEITADLPSQMTGTASLFKVTALAHEIRNYRDAATADKASERIASLALYEQGFPGTPGLAGRISVVTSVGKVQEFLDAFRRAVSW